MPPNDHGAAPKFQEADQRPSMVSNGLCTGTLRYGTSSTTG